MIAYAFSIAGLISCEDLRQEGEEIADQLVAISIFPSEAML